MFASLGQEPPPDILVWRPARLMIRVPQDCIYLHNLKLPPEILATRQSGTWCSVDSSLWNTMGLGTASAMGA